MHPTDELRILREVDALRDANPRLVPLCAALADYLAALLDADAATIAVLDADGWTLVGATVPALCAAVSLLPAQGWREMALGDVHAFALAPSGGVIAAALVRGVVLDADQRARVDAFVLQADSALAQAVAWRALEDRNAELEAIYAIDHIRDQQLPFEQMLQAVMAHVVRVVPGHTAIVGLVTALEPDRPLSLHTVDGAAPSPAEAALVARFVREAFEARTVVRRAATADAPAGVCVPLILDELVLGGLVVLGEAFSARDARVLGAIGSQADTAIFEDLSRQRIKRVFKRYVNDQVVDEMLGQAEETDFLAGRRADVTVVFTDLRGFTSLGEGLEVDVLVGMLNEHLAAMTEVVFAHGGTVDKFIGDCVMAFWGAPMAREDHAEAAVRACLEMQAVHATMRADWRARGLPDPALGIGVNSGEVMVGNIGGDRLSSFTVIGDHVNLAARMEGLAEGGEVLITEHTRAGLGEGLSLASKGALTVRGKRAPVRAFRVLAATG